MTIDRPLRWAARGGLGLSLLWAAAALAAEAPAPQAVPASLTHYHRVAPFAATAGLLGPDGLDAARRLGFAMVVDLRTPAEGTERERREAARVGIGYLNLPVSGGLPGADQIAALARVVGDPANRPLLIHCRTAQRAGAAWALLQARAGAPADQVLAAGRAAGLAAAAEPAIRRRIGAAASPDAVESDGEEDAGNPFDRNDGDDMGC